ncbi:peroxidase 5-like [Nicotiana tabacum]|uniref:Peroxidase n=2 Tax=Nicotiana TaxID=4085 RepID=A0A1S4A313_TOBAC|nr:PREDICTED: peroxidase 5-like [Nicotiana sylvestris]XP_016471072.1 PREDICTED: peroxidase 5-like [Nicotiana tabacum]
MNSFKGSKFVMLALLFCLILSLSVFAEANKHKPKPKKSTFGVGFYKRSCPAAEAIIRKAVFKAVLMNPGTAAGIIRMHFHDCFIRGCDGSVLLDSVRGKETAEKDSPINNPSLRGFEVIDEAKALLEKLCPRTVSCADILAFAARDSALFAGGISYALPGGRRDGRVSLSSEVIQNLPPPFFNAQQLQDNFKRKGLSLDEMVTLSGAHSIGRTHCSSFSNRLYGFNATHPQDPSLDPRYASFLKNKCPRPISDTQVDPIVNLDISTPNRLDNKYYLNLKNHKGLLTSDQTLFESPLTSKLVFNNVKYGSTWARKFAAAMVHMGSIEVLTGNKGEIRKNCHFVN